MLRSKDSIQLVLSRYKKVQQIRDATGRSQLEERSLHGSLHCPWRFTLNNNFSETVRRIILKVLQNIGLKFPILLLKLALFLKGSRTEDCMQSQSGKWENFHSVLLFLASEKLFYKPPFVLHLSIVQSFASKNGNIEMNHVLI